MFCLGYGIRTTVLVGVWTLGLGLEYKLRLGYGLEYGLGYWLVYGLGLSQYSARTQTLPN